VNLHAEEEASVELDIAGFGAESGAGRTLAGAAIDSHNTFENPDAVTPAPLAVTVNGSVVAVSLPARSVSVITIARGGQ
jgi:alpha-L-arabinofuranosidase